MAITFYLGNGTAWGSSHGYVQDTGKLPSVVRTATGWIAGTKASGQSCLLNWGSIRASTAFGATIQPDGASALSTNDCLRSVNSYRGTFSNANWSFSLAFRSSSATAYSGRFRIRVRVWKSVNQDGTSATELTSGAIIIGPTTASLSTTTSQVITGTWTSPGSITLTDEYLFFQIGIEVTSAGGNTSSNVLFVTDSTNSIITTPTFTPATNAYTRNVVANLPTLAGQGGSPASIDYVLADDGPTIPAIQQDLNPSGSKDLFTFVLASTGASTDKYYLIVSTDGGTTWSAIGATNSEPNVDTNHFPNLQAIVQDDSAYAVHAVGKNATDSNLWYSRITLSYTSGHITGWSWAAERSATPSLDPTLVQPYRVTMQRITDGNGVKRLQVTCLDDPASGVPGVGVICRLIVFATIPTAGLAPTGNTSWCKLTNHSSTNAVDILGDWSSNTTSDANSLKHFTSQSAGQQNSYNNCCTSAQIGTNKDIHVFMGGYYYNDAQGAPGSIWRWRLTASGGDWANDGTVNGATIATDNTTNRPCLGNSIGRTNAVYLSYYDATGVPLIWKVNSSGTATGSPFGSLETAVAGSMGYIGFSVSSDETQCWASYMMGFNTGPLWRVAHYNGTSWVIKYDETLDWNNSATGESVPWWTCQDIFDGVVIGSYQFGDYATTHHHNAVHVFRSAATAAGAALTGAVTTSSALTAALSTSIAMTAAVSGSSSLTASLTTAIRPTAAVATSSQLTASLSTAIAMTAAVGTGASLTADLSTAIPLTAGVQGSSSLTAALTTAIRMTAAVQASSTLTASMGGTAAQLQASVVGSSSLTASLTTAIPLTAAVSTNSTVHADLATQIRLSGAVGASSSLTASLSTGIALVAQVTTSSTLTAVMGSDPAMHASVQSGSSLTANLTTAIPLVGAVQTSTRLGAALTTAIPLAAAVGGASSLSAQLTTSIALTAATPGASTLQADLSTAIPLRADVRSGSTLHADFILFVAIPAASGVQLLFSGFPSIAFLE